MMMLDEEAAANAAAVVPPGAPAPRGRPAPAEGMDPEMAAEREGAAPREASPSDIKAYSTMIKQALGMLTSEDGAQALLELSKSMGPDKALAQVVGRVMDGVSAAAEAAGVTLSDDVKFSALRPVMLLLSGLMAKSGLVDDPRALAAAALQTLEGGQNEPVEALDGPVG